MNRPTWVALTAATGLLALAPAAGAATLSVDDDGDECPSAQYSSVQDAIDAADPGDTVTICEGTYTEGSGAPSTNAVTITKDLTLKGAGADLVTIQPRRSTPSGGQIAAGSPVIRNGVGNILAAVGGSSVPINVDISGVTLRGNSVYSEVGALFLDAQGSLVRSHVTDVVTSEGANAFSQAGGFRSNQFGWGVAHVTAADSPPPSNPTRVLALDHTRIDRFNRGGVLVSSATDDSAPLTDSGVDNRVEIESSHVIGRIKCQNFPQDGNCTNPQWLDSGPLFGQDGVRVAGGASAAIDESLIASNAVNGTGVPLRSSFNTSCTTFTPNTTNNANLSLGAGLRLIGADASTVTRTNLVDNSYAVVNLEADGTTPNAAVPLNAENNWWGANTCRGFGPAAPLAGPEVSPTSNPPFGENPVNGTPVADPTCAHAPQLNSDTVDVCPYRPGPQSDSDLGEFLLADAPIPVSDEAPTVEIAADDTEYDRGETVSLTAEASDDFGVTSVRFFDGAVPIDTDGTAPYEQDFTIPNNAPCAPRTFTAVATDSSGQTASHSVVIDVVGPNNCVDPPDAPDIALDDPPATIPQEGVTVTALPDAPAGVTDVEFFLGTRSVCTDATGPDYTCLILPEGDEVGVQALRAVVTDDLDRTAEVSTAVEVEKFDPAGLTIEMDKDRFNRRKVMRTISGELELPERVTAEQGCDGGSVTLNVTRNGATLFPSAQAPLAEDCGYELSFRAKERKGDRPKPRYVVEGSFGGNDVFNPIANSGRFE
jgi:hypothetical protein